MGQYGGHILYFHLLKYTSRRQVKKSKSMLQLLLFGEEAIDTDLKSKNIKHTEIMVDLKEAILQVGHHFMSVDPKLNNIILVADYSMESHTLDHENYVNVSRTRRRRAKALLGKLNCNCNCNIEILKLIIYNLI